MLRVLDTFGNGLVDSTQIDVRVHAPESTCNRYPMGRAVVEVRHRVLDGQQMLDRKIPRYRMWKSFADSNHRVTTERAAVEEMTAKGWVDEGVAMCVRRS